MRTSKLNKDSRNTRFKQDIFIFGGGAWGLALAFALSRKNNVYILSRRDLSSQGVVLYNLDSKNHIKDISSIENKKNYKDDIEQKSEIMRILDSKKSDESPTNIPIQLQNKDFSNVYKSANNPLCIIAIASAFLRDFLKKADFLESFRPDMKILAASKGIEQGSGAFVSDILRDFFNSENLCYLAGPSFAKEVMAGLPCAVVIHSQNKILSRKYATCFPYFMKTYIQSDVVGAEIAGAYKNVIAIAGGICDGLGLGNNAKASLLSRGLVEMARFGKFFGARNKTFLGLSGSGDLFLTSSSKMSRNYRVGFALAQKKKLQDILIELGEVAEGVYSAKSITQIAIKHNLYTPIANQVQAILEGSSLQVALGNLLSKNKL